MRKKYIKWDITKKCNLRCSHCSVGKNYFSSKTEELSLSQKKVVVDKLAAGNVGSISFLGGEPLTLGDQFFGVVNYAHNLGIKSHLVTNGMLVKKNLYSKIIKSGISTIIFSLDGGSAYSHELIRGKDTFKITLNNLVNLNNYIKSNSMNIKIKINTVLNKINVEEITLMYNIFNDYGIDEWSLLSLNAIGFAEDNFDNLALSPQEEIDVAIKIAEIYTNSKNFNNLRIIPQFIYPLVNDYIRKEYRLELPEEQLCCTASINLGFISPDGMLYPCDRISLQRYKGCKIKDAIIRPISILNNSFYDVWNSDYFVNMFDLIFDYNTYKDYNPCNRCHYLKSRKCNPCPLYALNSKVKIQTCLIAEEKLGDISKPNDHYKATSISNLPNKSYNLFNTKPEIESNHENYIFMIPKRKKGVRYMMTNEDHYFFDPISSMIIKSNLVGSYVWENINGELSCDKIAKLVSNIVEDLEISDKSELVSNLSEDIKANVFLFIKELKKKNLIEFLDNK